MSHKFLDPDVEFEKWNDAIEELSSNIVEQCDSSTLLDDYGQAEALVGAMVHLILIHHGQSAETVLEMVADHVQQAEEMLADMEEAEATKETESDESPTPKKPLMN